MSNQEIYMKTICIKFASYKKDFISLADKINFLFDDNNYCFILRVFRFDKVYSFKFDEIESFSIY